MKLFTRTGKDELLETAMALHDAAMKDEYFIKRKLAPNVDFWYVLSPHYGVMTVAHGTRSFTGGELCQYMQAAGTANSHIHRQWSHLPCYG